MVGIVDCLVATFPRWSHLLECVAVVVDRGRLVLVWLNNGKVVVGKGWLVFPNLSHGLVAVSKQQVDCEVGHNRHVVSSVRSTGSHVLTVVWCGASRRPATTVVGEM